MSAYKVLTTEEIVRHVFRYLALDELLPLRRVNRLWNICARESDAFGDDVAYENDELSASAVAFFQLRLLARPHAVRVSIETRDPDPRLAEGLLLPIGQQLHRIVQLQLSLHPAQLPAVAGALRAPAPQLRKLSLDFDLDAEEDDEDEDVSVAELPLDLLAGYAPLLTDVSLSELVLPPAPVPAFATVRSVEFYLRNAGNVIARTIALLFTTLPQLSDLIIAVPRPLWTPAMANAAMDAGARRLRSVEVSAAQENLVRWLQAVADDYIGRVVLRDDIDTPALELFAGLLAARPTDDLALELTDSRALVRSLNVRGGATWERTLDNCPGHHPAWLAEWLAAPVHAHRVVHMTVQSAVWEGLCESVHALPNLTRLRMRLGRHSVAMGEVELEGVLVCPALREATMVAEVDEEDVTDDALRSFAQRALQHGQYIPQLGLERSVPEDILY